MFSIDRDSGLSPQDHGRPPPRIDYAAFLNVFFIAVFKLSPVLTRPPWKIVSFSPRLCFDELAPETPFVRDRG